ncbi:MAG: enoyl-CoA hydratase-related protein [Gemmatimonadetes bacterium]|nr:enoyl-CoA hydratase-related protein [Gemmatimonadota bacterium]
MEFELILVETTDRVATITINRPDKLNALNATVFAELSAAVEALNANADVGVIVITGAGRSFVAGADIAELATKSAAELEARSRAGQVTFRAIERSPKPVIAAVNGFALGGGCELALACHVRFASTKAKFGLPETKLGLIPGYGGTQRLPRLIGRGPALRLILSGETIDGTEAFRLGIADGLAEPEALMAAVVAFAKTVLANGPLALARAIESVDSGLDLPFDAATANESRLFGSLGDTADMREGVQAFLEKRPAMFRGA